MFSALVLVQHGSKGAPSGEAVARTLAALVPAAVEGLVRDAALVSPWPNEDFSRIADHAGCEYVQSESADPVAAGLAALKQRRVFVLRAGRAPERGFIGELADFAACPAQRCGLLLDAPHSFLTRLLPRLSRASGLVAPRETLKGAGPDIAAMAKALPSPLVFRARMIGPD